MFKLCVSNQIINYETLMYLADGSGGNPINFHLIASVFNDLCSEFFGKTKDG